MPGTAVQSMVTCEAEEQRKDLQSYSDEDKLVAVQIVFLCY